MNRSLAILLCLLTLPAVAGARDDKPKRLAVDFAVGWGGCYRPMQWTPLRVSIASPFKKPIDCIVEVTVKEDELHNMVISRREVLAPGRTRRIDLAARIAFAADDCRLTIYDSTSGMLRWSKSYSLWQHHHGGRMLTAVRDEDLLIGVTGRQGFALDMLPDATESLQDSERGRTYLQFRFPRRLPSDWTGYAALDALILYDPDWAEMTRHQQRALDRWVRNGGRVLIVLGSHALPAGHAVAALLPFPPGSPRQVGLSARDLRNWGCRTWQTDKVAAWDLRAAKHRPMWDTWSGQGGKVLGASGPAGFGRVGVWAFDPDRLGVRRDRRLAAFWVSRLADVLGRRKIRLSNRRGGDSSDDWSYELGTSRRAVNAVLEYLYAVEELRPIHVGWVVLVLVALAVLIGPVDYLVLRALGRLPWTWATASLGIAVFSVGAYYGVEHLRGGELQARVVSVVDGVAGERSAWATRYMGIFAPRSDDHALTGLSPEQWWSALAPTQGETLYSYRQELGSRNIYCTQHVDGGCVPRSIPINIWAMQCLLVETPAAGLPVRADVRKARDGQWEVAVENLADTPVAEGYVVVSPTQCVRFGRIEPKAERTVRARAGTWKPWDRDIPDVSGHSPTPTMISAAHALRSAPAATGTARRTDGMMAYVRAGAVIVCAEYEGLPVPHEVAGRTCRFQHRQLVRLVVRPGTRSEP